MTDFLLELLSEEIPARMQEKACADLARLFADEIAKAGVAASALETYATPRRLALIARGLPEATEAVAEETKGPRAGAPPQALEGFLRKTGLTADQLVERDGVLYAVIDKPGRPTAAVLAEAIPAIVRGFPWPKSMRWGEGSLRWVRPLQGIVALLGEMVVPFEIDGIASGAATVGHRFHHPGPITIGSADDYTFKLRTAHVILDPPERRAIIEAGAAEAAAAAGLSVVPDPGLIAENAGLTEWPVPLLGAFDPAFLDVPREVIQLTMRTNQKYFACVDAGGALAPNFICTANIDALDGGAGIVAGNRKVLAARLSDAKFFWEQDLKVPLAEQAKKLEGIVFHEKLGTVADKVERVAKLARWLVEEGIVGNSSPERGGGPSQSDGGGGSALGTSPSPLPLHRPADGPPPRAGEDRAHLAALAEQAARLCKADLVTGMVGEFPELQGVMGGYYARAEGLPDEVADAIRDHYKPVGQGDDVPTAPVTVAVSLADKLDTLAAFFVGEMPPTGSKDPFALRRATLNAVELILYNSLRLRLRDPLAISMARTAANVSGSEWAKRFDDLVKARHAAGDPMTLQEFETTKAELIERARSPGELAKFAKRGKEANLRLLDFVADRLKVQQREAGVRHDLIDAVFALGGEDDLVRLLARVRALQAFVATEDGVNLLAGYKRAANILRIEEKKDTPSPPVGEGRGEGVAAAGSMPDGANDSGVDPLSPTPLPPGEKGFSNLTKPNQMGYTTLPEEEALMTALAQTEPKATTAIAAEDFESAMRALAALRAPVDAFFEKVIVNDPDPAKRAARLALLARVRDAVHRVADFSRIEG